MSKRFFILLTLLFFIGCSNSKDNFEVIETSPIEVKVTESKSTKLVGEGDYHPSNTKESSKTKKIVKRKK